MSRVCKQCSRVNPPDAMFCYWDGAYLAGGAAGPIHAGSALFPSQFIFPNGQACRNFDQLAMTCQQNWQAAVGLLKQGFFATFLGGMGRADLAAIAKEAARFPDADRGLDQLLARLPTQVVQPPILKVEPSAVSLGVLPMGTNRTIELHLSNLGMRLAYGSVASDCKWLALGEGQGAGQKLFQFRAEAIIPVKVKGQFLRAGNQPLEGQLVVESNGGSATVTVRADVPIVPFKEGVLAGSMTPRQIAEKARLHPKEAAPLFEQGLISQWFSANGWTYPVQGPTISGLGGIQQFFEALGLANPPKVELRTPRLTLQGNPGQTLSAAIEVATAEKKHVFAFAVSDKPWVVPGFQPKEGKSPTSARIPLTIQAPRTPGQVIQASITVTANGNQKFKVPLTLTMSGSPGDFVPAQPMPLPAKASVGGAVPIMATPIGTSVKAAPAAKGQAIQPVPAVSIATAPTTLSARPLVPAPVFATSAVAPAQSAPALIDLPSTMKRRGKSLWVHLAPLGALALVLAALTVRDLIGNPPGEVIALSTDVDPTPRLRLQFDFGNEKGVRNSLTFGLTMVDPASPNEIDPKRLTYDHLGRTNSTVASIDGADKLFGFQKFGKWVSKPAKAGHYGGEAVTFQYTPNRIFVTQTVQIMPGEATEMAPGVHKYPLNACLIKYKVENKDARPHKIGLRVMVDTLIGKNDGVPFTIPGVPGLVSTFKDMRSPAEIPDFIQALEYPDLEHPGTVVQMSLKLSERLAPDRVSLTHWPGHDFGAWEVPVRAIAPKTGDEDSAIVLYWNPTHIKPGDEREMAFSYGLGNLKGGKLALTVGGTLAVNREMTVIAYVADPRPGEKATLKLPDGFDFIGGSEPTQPVPEAQRDAAGKVRPSPVTWRVTPRMDGRHTLSVTTTTNLSVSQAVTISKKGIF